MEISVSAWLSRFFQKKENTMMQNKAHTGHVPPLRKNTLRKIETSNKEYVLDSSVSLTGELGNQKIKIDREELSRLFSIENLHTAFNKAKQNKGNRKTIQYYSETLSERLEYIRRKILVDEYKFGPYREFMVRDPKWRLIISSPLKDRVVHWVLYDYLLPLWEPVFIKETYGNLPGRGTVQALNKAKMLMKSQKYTYILKMDFSKYFYSIHHAILICELQKKVKNHFVMKLLEELICSYRTGNIFDNLFSADSLFHSSENKGMPIGSLTSQLFANIYLNTLDHYIKDFIGATGYIRYVDDIIVFTESKNHAKHICEEIVNFSSLSLKLTLNPKKIAIFPKQKGLDFVGYRIFTTHILPRKRCQKKLRKLLDIGVMHPQITSSHIGYLSQTDSHLYNLFLMSAF